MTRAGIREPMRWAACFALALAFHGVGAAALLARWSDEADTVASAPAILIDLAPLPAAPPTPRAELPPGPQQVEAQPQPEPIKPVIATEQKPDPLPDPLLTAMPPPRPPEPPKHQKPKREHQAALTSAPSPAERKADRAAAAAPGSASVNANAIPSWRSLVAAALERNKRYPAEAQAHGDRGVAQLAFSIDRRGGVHNVRIVRSSGSAILDRETLALVERAQPLPPPPPELAGAQIAITVPIRYSIR